MDLGLESKGVLEVRYVVCTLDSFGGHAIYIQGLTR